MLVYVKCRNDLGSRPSVAKWYGFSATALRLLEYLVAIAISAERLVVALMLLFAYIFIKRSLSEGYNFFFNFLFSNIVPLGKTSGSVFSPPQDVLLNIISAGMIVYDFCPVEKIELSCPVL